ncbi:hypothetical protein A2U01_0003602, partial [Trifolium medium]|nr:hypothetical protein [Trifolium medium]
RRSLLFFLSPPQLTQSHIRTTPNTTEPPPFTFSPSESDPLRCSFGRGGVFAFKAAAPLQSKVLRRRDLVLYASWLCWGCFDDETSLRSPPLSCPPGL